MLELNTDQAIDRLGQEIEDDIGNPTPLRSRGPGSVVGQMREQILNRFGRPVDGDARLGGRLSLKRGGVDVESTGSADAGGWRIPEQRPQRAPVVRQGVQ